MSDINSAQRTSFVDLAMTVYPGDLLLQQPRRNAEINHHKKLIKRNTVADFYSNASIDVHGASISDDATRKGRQSFSLLKMIKTRSKDNLSRLDDILRRLKPSEFKDNHLAAYKTLHWSDVIASSDKSTIHTEVSETERKRREAVWELLRSECVFLIDHCMVLKHCFMEPMKKVQVEGSLMYVEPQEIFGNLDELCYVSYTFSKDFISALLKDMDGSDFGRTKVLITAFQRFSTHSKDGAVFHNYCINYSNAIAYLDKLRRNTDFVEFEKWCEQDPRCNRLQLNDLLVAPLQHCMKLPLLLANVRRYTENETEQKMVTDSIEKVETSLKQLEEKMRWIRNVERVQEVQRHMVWPTVGELEPRCVIPDCLKSSLSTQPSEGLLSDTKRVLLHEGLLTLMESPKSIDVHVFLFDDLLLITKVKKHARKKQNDVAVRCPSSTAKERISYIVIRQPLAMDRFYIHDVASADASANGMKHLIVLVHISRFQQIIGLYSLQAQCEVSKTTWLTLIREAKNRYTEQQHNSRHNSFKEHRNSSQVNSRTVSQHIHSHKSQKNAEFPTLRRRLTTKSRSLDAVFV